jgi:hypothetical protein
MRALLIAAAAVLVLSGCNTSVVRKSVERRIERRLHGVVGPAERYDVRIRNTRDAELVKGRARRVEIEGRKIHLKEQLMVDSLKVTLDNLRYEGGEPYFVSVQRSDLAVEFTEDAINRYLREYHARYDPHVELDPELVTVRMLYTFLGTPTPIRAKGRFVVREGRLLLFDAESADVSFIDRPGFGEQFVEDRVNPLLDLSRLDFPARLESVQVLDGRLRAWGSAALPREGRD